jgi:hypothetical protein
VTDKYILVSWTKTTCTHDRQVEPNRLTGEKRKSEAIMMAAYGISNHIDKKIIRG